MATEISFLRIKSERLGTVSEVTKLLFDFEAAYNSLYVFDFLVDTLAIDRERNFRQLDEKFYRLMRYWKESPNRKDFAFDPYLYELFLDNYTSKKSSINLVNLVEIKGGLDFNKVILPRDKLVISKVNIQSLGFWEFLGNLNPLQQIREYLKDRHERIKDTNYKSRQEEELADLEIIERRDRIISQRIETLRGLGYSELEIRQLVTAMIIQPLSSLGRHQDNGQIEGPDEQ